MKHLIHVYRFQGHWWFRVDGFSTPAALNKTPTQQFTSTDPPDDILRAVLWPHTLEGGHAALTARGATIDIHLQEEIPHERFAQ